MTGIPVTDSTAPAIVPAPAERLTWYAQRLRSMPPPEVTHRVVEVVRQRHYRRRPPPLPAPAGPGLRHRPLAAWTLGYARSPEVRAYWAAAAERLCSGDVHVFGARWPTGADGVPDWYADPATGGRWPAAYCFDVDYRHRPGGLGDVKDVWEVNRLQYLVPVAAHAAVTADAGLARRCAAHVLDWIARVSPRTGVAWASGIECALRLVSMRTVVELVGDLVDDPAFTSAVTGSIAVQAGWVRRFPSRYSSANNHRLAELTGLLAAGLLVPGAVAAADVADARAELVTEALRQVHRDGVSAEQSTAYGGFALEWLAVAALLADTAGRPLPATVVARVRAGVLAWAALRDCAGNVVRIGDDDGSRVITAALPEALTLDAVGAMVGLSAAELAAHEGMTTLPDGGYTVVRGHVDGAETLWVLDHGPLGHGHIAAHAHADTLAVWLHYGGRPVLAEAGTYRYHGAGAWREHLRGTGAHNTVVLAGLDSSVPSGPFNWQPRQRAVGRLRGHDPDPARWYVEAVHDGYRRRLGVDHVRRLARVGPGTFQLTDRVMPAGRPAAAGRAASVEARWAVLLAPDLDAEPLPDGWLVRRGGVAVARLRVPPGWATGQVRGQRAPLAGWCSPAFGAVQPAWQLRATGVLGAGRPLTVDVLLGPAAAAGAQAAEARP